MSNQQIGEEKPRGDLNSNSNENNEQSSSERVRPQDLRSQQRPALANHLIREFQNQLPMPPQPSAESASQFDCAPGKESSSNASGMPNSQGRLVVVSNRLIDPKKPAAGGLGVALGEMMHNNDGLWFGWSGKTTDEPGSSSVRTELFGRSTLAQVDLSKQHHDNYYAGFSNSVLWPIFHEQVEWAELKPEYFESYEQVNKMFASQLAPILKDNDVLWIHDYHLIPLAQELRALGCTQRIGFFNHIPLPPPEVIKQIPQHKQLMKALFAYDLVGIQCPKDAENLHRYVEMEGAGQRLDGSIVDAFGKKASVRHFPIGIDVKNLEALVPSPDSQAILGEVRNESGKRKLMIGVDRLDYSKGIPNRLEAFRELLETRPEMRNQVTFVQIAAPTRQSVPAYAKLSEETRKLVDEINAQFGTNSWKPVMYFNESVSRDSLPDLYRLSRVGVVTPVADGMNLVAKEYVAAQAPEAPGVLVLSTGAGAAFQLNKSLLVPPTDRAAIAKAYEQALTMSLEERQERHAALLNNVKTEDLSWWRGTYLAALYSVPSFSATGDQRAVIEDASTTSRNRDDGAASQAASLDQRFAAKAAAHPELNAVIARFASRSGDKSVDEIDQIRQLIQSIQAQAARILDHAEPIDRPQYVIEQFLSDKDQGSSAKGGPKRIKDYLEEDDTEWGNHLDQAIQSIRVQAPIARIPDHQDERIKTHHSLSRFGALRRKFFKNP